MSFEDSLCDLQPACVQFATQFGDVFQVASNFGFVGAGSELFRDTFQLLLFRFKVRDGDSEDLQQLSSFVDWLWCLCYALNMCVELPPYGDGWVGFFMARRRPFR